MRHNPARSAQRGVVLITVVLLLLVLTVLGMTAAIMMTQEDRSSSNASMQKEALYVAEAGLRRGEFILRNFVVYSNPTLTNMISRTSTAQCPAVTPKVPQVPTAGNWDVQHLGTYLMSNGVGGGGATEVANIEVTDTFKVSQRRLFYSLYVRNNETDGATPGTVNNDTLLRLISVGWVANRDQQPLAVKILEEEFTFFGAQQSPSAQKQSDQGGTGSGMFGG